MWWLIIPVSVYSAVIFALWLALRQKRDEEPPQPVSGIFISVVIACHNEEKNIIPVIDSLAGQNYPPDKFEIIITDDNSDDSTVPVINEYIAKRNPGNKVNIRLLHNASSGKKSALRLGIVSARGEFIITTDADCTSGKEWISSYASFYAKTGADMILGGVYEIAGKSLSSLFAASEFSALQGITEATTLIGHPVMCNGANMGFRKDIYCKHAHFLKDALPSGDDMFLLHAVKRSGGRILWLPYDVAAVGTAAAVTAAALLSQRARWASKAFYYSDAATLILAAATAACNAAVTAAAVISVINTKFLIVTMILYAVRIIPDYLMISHRMKKRKEMLNLPLFIIMELVYPFYFITVALLSMMPAMKRFRRQ